MTSADGECSGHRGLFDDDDVRTSTESHRCRSRESRPSQSRADSSGLRRTCGSERGSRWPGVGAGRQRPPRSQGGQWWHGGRVADVQNGVVVDVSDDAAAGRT